ncbi:MAG TPA: ATP synthase F0 subunit C [Thermoanaerobaculia bacterium]|nr:ATP synthase F0 subunit C [Thermoanaerobaculia bacterium]
MNRKMIFVTAALLLVAVSAFAQGEPAATAGGGVKWGAVSAAFLLGIAAAAGAIGQSRAIAAAVEGIARNPMAAGAIRLAMIIGLALIESLVIYALVIAFMIRNA